MGVWVLGFLAMGPQNKVLLRISGSYWRIAFAHISTEPEQGPYEDYCPSKGFRWASEALNPKSGRVNWSEAPNTGIRQICFRLVLLRPM